MDARYVSNFHICKVINERVYGLQVLCGYICQALVADIQLLLPVEYIVSFLLDTKAFERSHKYVNDPSIMPQLHQTILNGSNEK